MINNSITVEQFKEIMKNKEGENVQLYTNEHDGLIVNMIVEKTEFQKMYNEMTFSNKQSNFTIDTDRIETIQFSKEKNEITIALDSSVQELIIEFH